MIATIAEKTAIAKKKKRKSSISAIVDSYFSLESGFHIIAIIAAIAELFFLSDRSDHGERSDHMETGLKKSCLLHKWAVFLVTK